MVGVPGPSNIVGPHLLFAEFGERHGRHRPLRAAGRITGVKRASPRQPGARNLLVVLLVGRVAGVASQPQLRGALFEFVLGPRLACIVGIVSAGFAFLVEEIEALPNGRICESVGGRIPRSIRRPRVSGRREKMREGQQHPGDGVRVVTAHRKINLARLKHLINRVHVVGNSGHEYLSRKDYVLWRDAALLLAQHARDCGGKKCSRERGYGLPPVDPLRVTHIVLLVSLFVIRTRFDLTRYSTADLRI